MLLCNLYKFKSTQTLVLFLANGHDHNLKVTVGNKPVNKKNIQSMSWSNSDNRSGGNASVGIECLDSFADTVKFF